MALGEPYMLSFAILVLKSLSLRLFRHLQIQTLWVCAVKHYGCVIYRKLTDFKVCQCLLDCRSQIHQLIEDPYRRKSLQFNIRINAVSVVPSGGETDVHRANTDVRWVGFHPLLSIAGSFETANPRIVPHAQTDNFTAVSDFCSLQTMPWGELSSIRDVHPTKCNDGPILWMRPGPDRIKLLRT